MFDLHVHLLPGLDDGCESLDQSISLARYLASEGVTHAVATVHYLPGMYEILPEAAHAALEETSRALATEGIALDVSLAHEIMIHQGIAERIRAGELIGMGPAQRYALVEFSSREVPWFAFTTLDHMAELGITPIVAHPERCYPLQRDVAELRSWFAKGILAQLDLGSLLGMHGSRIQRFSEYLVRNHLVHILGSDLHAPPSRPELWRRACRKIGKLGGDEYATIVAEDLPRMVLNGEDIARLVPHPLRARSFSLGSLASSILGYSTKE